MTLIHEFFLVPFDSGIGYTHINSLFTALNIPTINRSAYKRREREIGLANEEVAASSFRMALENEIEIEKSLGKTPDPDGLPSTSHYFIFNHKNYNFLACDWFKKVLFSTNPLAKLLSDSLLLDSLLLDSLLSDSSISQSHSKM